MFNFRGRRGALRRISFTCKETCCSRSPFVLRCIMKLVTIDSKTLHKYTADPEMLQKAKRPCVLVVKLKYKGSRYDFAIPLRSNISPATPKDLYFPLPPRSTTKSKYRHGLHYAKMFPIDRSKALRYRIAGNAFAVLVKNIIDKNEKTIIRQAQDYLSRYESGNIPPYSTDIDFLLKQM